MENANETYHNRALSSDSWGHRMKKKQENHTRICFVNVNGIGVSKKSPKSEDIRIFMHSHDVDVMGMAETNVNWAKVSTSHTLWDRTRTWFDRRVIAVAYNTLDKIGKFRRQPGGCACLVRDKVAHRHKDNGFDSSGLGRWSWVRIAGKQGCSTRFVTVYCPVKTGNGNTVYNQQLRELNEDPTSRFWKDLSKQILEWQSQGDQLLISGDWNEEVSSPNMTEWAKLLGLTDIITSMHPGPSPPTFHRGSSTVDAIFATPSLTGNRSGYLGFGVVPGDHRCLWVDIPDSKIMGYDIRDIPRPSARRLKLEDPRVVDRYLYLLDSYCTSHNLYGQLASLKSDFEKLGKWTPQLTREYDRLDGLREAGMHYAERKCRKLKMGAVVWSPALQKARDTILFWTLLQRKRRRCHVSMRRILRLKKRLKITNEMTLSNEEVRFELDMAYQRYKKLKKRAYEERLNFQEALAQAKSDKQDGDAVKILRQMQARESMRSMYQQIGSSLKQPSGSTTKIHVKTDTGIQEITQMLAMEQYILAENETKFHQTEGWSPLLSGQLAQDIGLLGDGPRVKDILQGTYRAPPGTPSVVQRWLDTLKAPSESAQNWHFSTLQEYQKGWTLVKERTSSGALHFGHFKAGTTSSTLGWLHYTFSMLPMQYGFSPSRWKQGTDVMILKAPNVFLLDKLRTIVLYEADFNHENRRVGKSAMHLALEHNLIAAEQFSRPGRSAQDNAIGKRLVFDHFRFLKAPFGMCACDLKSCYDRVVHSAASLALQRVGVPVSVLQCMFGTIADLIHTVRTAYGKSTDTYGGASPLFLSKPQGLGQGNGSGPTVWSVLSSTVFESLHAQGYSTTFCSALSLALLRLCGFSYVDDCDLIADGLTVGAVYRRLQTILTEWDHLMQVNGAALATDKCWWYLVDFEWKLGKWKYVSPLPTHALVARDKSGRIQSLERLHHSQSREMVGVTLAPDGNSKEQVQSLRSKTKKWAAKITKSPLEEDSVWTALQLTICKTVQFPLAATTLTPAELTHIMAPALMTALPRANIVRSFPRDILYGPVAVQGLGLTDPYLYQFCRHVQDIVDQPWRQTEIGYLLRLNLEAAKLEAGIYGSLFDSPVHVTWFNTTCSWIVDTLHFCQAHDICFEEPIPNLVPNCDNDQSLMEVFSSMVFTKAQLVALNRCRLYCRVVSLSDLVDGYGSHLVLDQMPKPVQLEGLYRYAWPHQGKPTQSDWDLWLEAISTAFSGSGRSLQSRLGPWTPSFKTVHPHWPSYLSDGLLYTCTYGQWVQHSLIHASCLKQLHFSLDGIPCFSPPENALPTRVIRTPSYLITTGTRPIAPRPPPKPPPGTLYETFHSFPDATWICKWVQEPPNLEEFAASLFQGQGLGVSDGSCHLTWDLCSAAWTLWTPLGELRGGGTIPGPTRSSTSYRGELGGLLGLVLVLHALESLFSPTHSYDIKLACDGLSALTKSLLSGREYFNSSNKDFDLISRIISYRETLRAHIFPIHVKGHQTVGLSPKTRASFLNDKMDLLAKAINRHSYLCHLDVPDALPLSSHGFIQVDHDSEPIVSDLASTLVLRISTKRATAYWRKRGRLPPPYAMDWIDWEVMSTTTKELSRRMKLFVAKWVSNQAAVGSVMLQRNAREQGLCPCCLQVVETRTHVLRCQSPGSTMTWKKGLKLLRRWLRQRKTEPALAHALIHILYRFPRRQDYNTYTPQDFPPTVQLCLNAQSHLGWSAFLEGILTTDWAAVQQSYYTSIGSRRTGHRWAVGLSTQIWKIVFSMWDHRNKTLHAKEACDSLSGLDIVKTSILSELQKGLDHLDPIYSSYFSISPSSISTMKSVDARNWLLLIRRARMAQGDIYTDTISTSPALQKWIGLHKTAQTVHMKYSRTGYAC